MSNFHSVKIVDIKRETADCISISFDIPANLKEDFKFIPGQYLTLKTEINGESLRRSYSLCSSPSDNEWRVAIKQIPEGRFSTFANTSLKVGDRIETMKPMGNFVVKTNPEHSKNYASFTAGSGITPILSIIKSVMQDEPNSTFILFYGNQTMASTIFLEELEALKKLYSGRLNVHYVLSREEATSELLCGRITPEKCIKFSNVIDGLDKIDEYFLCGPGGMVSDLKKHFIALGVDSSTVHTELFTAPEVAQEAESPTREEEGETLTGTSHIQIILDDEEYEFDLEFDTINILDAAVKKGIDLPFACKGGVCCTCKAQVIEGKADMKMNYALEPDEVEDGFILTCQSFPKSKLVKIDFDA